MHGIGCCPRRKPGREVFELLVDTFFPRAVLVREELYTDDVIKSLLRPKQGDPDPKEFMPRDEFRLVVISSAEEMPTLTAASCSVVEIKAKSDPKPAIGGGSAATLAAQQAEDQELEDAFGLREKIRNSKELVEAGFEGDLEAVKSWLEKDYHLESKDGQKATCLSEGR